jgi:hypothetical protein
MELDREEAIKRIVAERDYVYGLLGRMLESMTTLQRPPTSTSTQPHCPYSFAFSTNDEDGRRLEDLMLHYALRRMPTPTPLPPVG